MKRYKLAPLARPDRSSLRERLTASRAAADRVFGGCPAGEVTGQPEGERLTTGASVEGGATVFRKSPSAQQHGQRELSADLNRAGAEGGCRGSAETDIGRHETFDLFTSTIAGRSLIEPARAESRSASSLAGLSAVDANQHSSLPGLGSQFDASYAAWLSAVEAA